MPAPIGWSAKFGPDPEHPGYVKVVGSYAHDFIEWAKILGRPCWHPQRRDQCVLSRPYDISDPDKALTKKEVFSPEAFQKKYGARYLQMYWPLAVLEPVFERMLTRSPIGLIDPHTGEPRMKSCI